MFRLAGEVGVDPWQYSLRQLDWMAQAKRQSEWSRTSAIVAMVHNQGWRTKRPRPARDFNPCRRKAVASRPLSAKEHVALLKSILLPRKE